MKNESKGNSKRLREQFSAFGLRYASDAGDSSFASEHGGDSTNEQKLGRRNNQKPCISSGLKALDDYFDGGLPVGSVSEWGVPFGRRGREVVLNWAAQLTKNGSKCLWISAQTDLDVYPPAWTARGVSLRHMRFAVSSSPVKELKPVFLESVFKLIILDSPNGFTDDDSAFLSHQAREHGYTILLLRNWFLSPNKGNVWAKFRVNCWQDGISNQMHLRTVKGLSARKLSLNLTRGTDLLDGLLDDKNRSPRQLHRAFGLS